MSEHLTDSEFNLWRVLIAIAHADGHIAPQERAYLEKVIEAVAYRFHLSLAQRDLLMSDLEEPAVVDYLLPAITDPDVRTALIGFAQDIAWLDGELHPAEEALLDHLRVKVGDTRNAPRPDLHDLHSHGMKSGGASSDTPEQIEVSSSPCMAAEHENPAPAPDTADSARVGAWGRILNKFGIVIQ